MLLICTTRERGCHLSSFSRETGGTSNRSQLKGGIFRPCVGPGLVVLPPPPPALSGPTQFQAQIEGRREVMSIQAILYQKGANVETIAPDAPVRDAAAKLREKNI